MATHSSLDLTVTYDYTAESEHSPCRNSTDNRHSERFVSLFPFAESPSVRTKSVVRGSALWKELSPQSVPLPNRPHNERPSQDLLQLNKIAHKLRESLCNCQATETHQLFPSQSKKGGDSSLDDTQCNCSVSDCDEFDDQEHWFWTQVAEATCDIDSVGRHSSHDQLTQGGETNLLTNNCRPVCSQDEIMRKRELARERLRANRSS